MAGEAHVSSSDDDGDNSDSGGEFSFSVETEEAGVASAGPAASTLASELEALESELALKKAALEEMGTHLEEITARSFDLEERLKEAENARDRKAESERYEMQRADKAEQALESMSTKLEN